MDPLDPARPPYVVPVYGMCTHTAQWATDSMVQLVDAINANVRLDLPALAQSAGPIPNIELVRGSAVVAGSQLRFTGPVWSPLTAG